MTRKLKDFVFSIILILLGSYVIIEGMNIYHKAAQKPYKVTQFTVSPGFLPVLLGIALTFTALILLISSFKGEKFGEALANRKTEFITWTKTAFNYIPCCNICVSPNRTGMEIGPVSGSGCCPDCFAVQIRLWSRTAGIRRNDYAICFAGFSDCSSAI